MTLEEQVILLTIYKPPCFRARFLGVPTIRASKVPKVIILLLKL
jgi:hypothetical protein